MGWRVQDLLAEIFRPCLMDLAKGFPGHRRHHVYAHPDYVIKDPANLAQRELKVTNHLSGLLLHVADGDHALTALSRGRCVIGGYPAAQIDEAKVT